MYFSKATLKAGGGLWNMLSSTSGVNVYSTHQLIWKLFPNDGRKKRDFLYRKDENSKLPSFFLVSEDKPESIDGFEVIVKQYTPSIKKGQRLSFNLLANPVVSRVGDNKKHNVWVDAKRAAKKEGLESKDIRRYCEDRSKEWLKTRGLVNGFDLEVEQIEINGKFDHQFYKKNKRVKFTSILYDGLLTVTEPDSFVKMLYNGIGRSKSFGCGMMMVRKA